MGEVSNEASMTEPRGAWEQSRSTIAVVPADSNPDKGAANTTLKVLLKHHFRPFITLKPISDLLNRLHHVLELQEYSNSP
jgi:hypothetical protein